MLYYFYQQRSGKLVVDKDVAEISSKAFYRAIREEIEEDTASRDLYLTLLLSYGADFKVINSFGEVILDRTCRKNFVLTALKIVELDPNQINIASFSQETPFMRAICVQNERLTWEFLKKGAALDIVDDGKNTPLMHAALRGAFPFLRWYIVQENPILL